MCYTYHSHQLNYAGHTAKHRINANAIFTILVTLVFSNTASKPNYIVEHTSLVLVSAIEMTLCTNY